ncbi:MAG: 2-C-methyl-D-erythritol 4-phosphate cytidylyltransferase [Clostridia bacterium]|nr:2-C-methyl-D-erythritol 4-phosphate cytidylyltransferase [Clostridia bacterium]
MKISGIILAAGNSTRFGQNKNKNLFEINGEPIISNSLKIFDNSEKINEILLVIKKEEKEYFEEIIKRNKFKKTIKYVIGGNTRKASVYNAISQIDSDYVVIHDGARPNIKEEYIEKSIKELEEYKGVTIAVKAKDTIKICNENQEVVETTKRSNTWLIQTPQSFDRKILKEAHEKFDANDESLTDDCMILEKCGYTVKVIQGDYENIKVTTFGDIKLV